MKTLGRIGTPDVTVGVVGVCMRPDVARAIYSNRIYYERAATGIQFADCLVFIRQAVADRGYTSIPSHHRYSAHTTANNNILSGGSRARRLFPHR